MENYKENIKIGDVVYMIMTSCTAGGNRGCPRNATCSRCPAN